MLSASISTHTTHTHTHVRRLRIVITTAMASVCLFLFLPHAHAQWVPVPCAGSVPENHVAPFPATLNEDVVVNADMIQVGRGGQTLKAIAYAKRGSSPQGYVYAEDFAGHSVNFALATSGACKADIALGASDAQGGVASYRAVIAYQANNQLYYDIWSFKDVGLPTFAATHVSTTGPLNQPGDLLDDYHNDPHVDMWSDLNVLDPATGLPTMHKFAIVWTEGIRKWPWCVPPDMINGVPFYPNPLPIYADQLYITVGDLNGAVYVPPLPIDTGFYQPDVACVTDNSSGTAVEKAEIVHSYICNGSFQVVEFDVPTRTTTMVWNASVGGLFSPRIEAMSQYYGTGDYKWMAVSSVSNIGLIPQWQAWNFYPNPGGGVTWNWVSSMYSNPTDSDMKAPCIAAAVDPGMSSDLGNQQYTIGFFPRTKTDLTEIAWTTNAGLVSSNYYIPNCGMVNYPWDAARSMAVTSCSNSGLNLLTAWYDGMDIVYKESPNAMVFKPGQSTGVGYTTNSSGTLSIWPNPANDELRLGGARAGSAYQILDLSGRQVQAGSVGKYLTVSVHSLVPGSYLLQISGDARRQTTRFIKQ
ncbi:MAG: T9SS type A sorting domain-containing protein [Bacteroidetes bacterium]|nr:T9SS type A sorting domain-containing protein [Bacteroidota bacterium]